MMETLRTHSSQHSSSTLARYPTATYSVQSGRISFAPGTRFTRKLESRVSDRARSSSLNIRPVQDGDRQPVLRFRPPRATAPSLPSQSVTNSDYMDPRYALEYAKWSAIPPWFCRSKSDALVSDRFAEDVQARVKPDTDDDMPKIHDIAFDEDDFENDGFQHEARISSSHSSCTLPGRLRDSQSSITSLPTRVSSVYRVRQGSGKQFRPPIPHYKPLVGEVYNLKRFYPPLNPWRSLQLESEVTQYVEHKKKCKGRNVRFTDTIDVTIREPHVVNAERGPIQRPYVKRRSLDDRARQTRVADTIPNASASAVVQQQDKLYDKQEELKRMLKRC